jgi:hypothetical protein
VPATTAGVQDDGMMHNFVPVPTHVPSHSQEKEVEQPKPTAAETVVERLPSDEERERLSASQGTALGAAGGAGLAGVGAFAAHQHHSPATTETATFDHALPPATTVTAGLLHHHQTVTEGGSIDQTRPSAIDGHPIPVDGAGAPVPVPASVAGLARGGAVGGGTGSISRRDLKKIEKAEHKDNKSLAKIMKSEAKHEAAVLEAAIKELARMQTTVKDSAKLEAKSARSRDEMIKIEQRTNAKFLEVKAVHDKAVAELRAKEEEHEVRSSHGLAPDHAFDLTTNDVCCSPCRSTSARPRPPPIRWPSRRARSRSSAPLRPGTTASVVRPLSSRLTLFWDSRLTYDLLLYRAKQLRSLLR